MWKTVIRRVLLMIPQLIILSILVFILAKLMPGDALSGMINPHMNPAEIEKIRRAMGLYDPWYVQYIRWVKNIFHGNFGMSYQFKLPVLQVIGPRAMNTFWLSLLALIIMYSASIPIAIYAGKNNGGKFDKAVILGNFLIFAVPSFVMYLFFILIFGYKLKLFPTIGSVSADVVPGTMAYVVSKFYHMLMPAICIAIMSSVGTIQYLRNEVIDAKGQDFVKTAKSKGVPKNKIYSHHIFRNSLLPIAAFFGFQITGLLGGSVIAETIFNYPGMGNFFMESIISRDFSVVTTLIMLYGILSLIGSLLSDITMSIVDPRIRIE